MVGLGDRVRSAKPGAMILGSLLVVACSWFLTIPLGTGPDAPFHQASTWCANGLQEGRCEQGSKPETRTVPRYILGTCQPGAPLDECGRELVETDQVNWQGLHVSAYYTLNSVFVGDNPRASILAMRLFNVALFAAVVLAAWWVAGARLRRALFLALGVASPAILWLVVAMTNQAWTIAGLVGFWVFVLAADERGDWRDVRFRTAAALAVLSVLMVVVSRSDGLILLAIEAAACFVIITDRRGVPFRWVVAVTAGLALVSGLLLQYVLAPNVFDYYIRFLQGEYGLYAKYDFPAAELLFHNLHHVAPFVAESLSGLHYTAGDGDPRGPSMYLVVFALGGLAYAVHGRATRTAVLVAASVATAMVAYPVLAGVRDGLTLPGFIVPRYLAPFAVAAIGLLLVSAPGSSRLVELPATARRAFVVLTGLSHASALHIALRSMATGNNLGISTWNLNDYVLWWWNIGVAPMTVWAAGSAAFVVLLRQGLDDQPPQATEVRGAA